MNETIERKETLRKMKVCRFCFNNDGGQLTNIYQKEPKTVPLSIQIMSCMSIEVFENDGFPQLICNSCKQQTNQSYVFRTNCREATDAFKKYLETGDLIKPLPALIQPIRIPVSQKTTTTASTSSGAETKNTTTKSIDDCDEGIRSAKKIKLNDGTEVITLCISGNEDSISQAKERQGPAQSKDSEAINEMVEDEPQESTVATDIFPCDRCDKSFPLEQLLEIHISSFHRERQFVCSICDKKFFTKYDLVKHQETHSTKECACSICGKVFAKEALLKRHELTHTDAPRFICAQCDKTFVFKQDLEAHIKKHEVSRPFTCTTCNKSFVFKQGLERHMKSVHTEPCKCNYCEASFNTPVRLTRHLTTHAGLRPYPCKICSRTFLLSHHLTRHMRSHFEKQPEEAVGQHKCDICSMSFRRKDSLINHSAIHSMVNLRCVICNTAFENAKMVKEHITTHLQGLPFPCEKCDYSFETEEQLLKHEVKHAEMEYEEQIEQEVISEVQQNKMMQYSGEESSMDGMLGDEESGDYDMHESDSISTFHLPDIDDPDSLVKSVTQSSSNDDIKPIFEKRKIKRTSSNSLSHIFSTDAANTTDEDDEESDDNEIKPIHRIEGTKMYQRRGPIQRIIPLMQPSQEGVQTASLEEINQRPNMPPVVPEALNNLPAEKPVNVKVGDKVVKVQKFIITKEEMKNMAKMGILEVKNGKVLMKSPGKPILNAKIKPVQQSDIENLIMGQKHQKPQVKQYERKNMSRNDKIFDT